MKMNIISKSKHNLPRYETIYSAGMDLCKNIEEKNTLKTLERVIVKTGLFIELPEDHKAQIGPRSSIATKFGISVLNTPGTIKADYRGKIKVILINLSNENIVIKDGDKICQVIIAKHERAV